MEAMHNGPRLDGTRRHRLGFDGRRNVQCWLLWTWRPRPRRPYAGAREGRHVGGDVVVQPHLGRRPQKSSRCSPAHRETLDGWKLRPEDRAVLSRTGAGTWSADRRSRQGWVGAFRTVAGCRSIGPSANRSRSRPDRLLMIKKIGMRGPRFQHGSRGKMRQRFHGSFC